MNPGLGFFVDSIVSAASHRYRHTRHILVGDISEFATSRLHGRQGSAQIEFGQTYHHEGWFVSPYAHVDYTYLSIDGYQEQGAGGLNNLTDRSHYHKLDVGVGTRLSFMYQNNAVSYFPELGALLTYDIYGDKQAVASRLLGGGATFLTSTQTPAQFKGRLDLGTNIYWDNYVLNARYELLLANKFVGNSLYLQLNYKW